MMFLFAFSCSSGENKKTDTIHFSAFKVTRAEQTHFSEFGKITKAVKLETMEKSLVGTIYRVIIDKTNGDILVGDYDSNKKVFRFSETGRYITSYGTIGAGPSEILELNGFCVTDAGDIILLGDSKIIKYSKSGIFLQETRIDGFGGDIESSKDKIFVSFLRYKKKPKEKKAIQIYDSFLVNIGGVGQYESNLEKYSFTSNNTLATSNGFIYFSDRYNFGLNIYDSASKKLSHLIIPSNNSALDSIWNKPHLAETDRTEIKNRLQFFTSIFSFNDGLILSEQYKEKGVITSGA